MLYRTINTCQKFHTAIDHKGDPTDEELDILQYLNFDLARSIVQDIGTHNAKQVAKIILGAVE